MLQGPRNFAADMTEPHSIRPSTGFSLTALERRWLLCAAALLVVAHLPVLTANFAIHNDYLLWLCDRSTFIAWFPETSHLLAIGRPLGALLAEPAFQLSRIASRFSGFSMVCAWRDARRSGASRRASQPPAAAPRRDGSLCGGMRLPPAFKPAVCGLDDQLCAGDADSPFGAGRLSAVGLGRGTAQPATAIGRLAAIPDCSSPLLESALHLSAECLVLPGSRFRQSALYAARLLATDPLPTHSGCGIHGRRNARLFCARAADLPPAVDLVLARDQSGPRTQSRNPV